jgi:hypothetical protein
VKFLNVLSIRTSRSASNAYCSARQTLGVVPTLC